MTIAEALGRGVRAERARLGLQQDALAEAVGKSRAWVGAVERGATNVGLGDVLALASALEASLATLLRDADDDDLRTLF